VHTSTFVIDPDKKINLYSYINNEYLGYPLFANKTFANRTFAIGERPLHSRQFTLWTLANWQESIVVSPIYPWVFADIGESQSNYRKFDFNRET
jgi:hypothetical protein